MTRLGWPELTALGILAVLTLHLTATGGALVGLCALGVLVLAARCFIADAQVDEALARAASGAVGPPGPPGPMGVSGPPCPHLAGPSLGDVIDGRTGGGRG